MSATVTAPEPTPFELYVNMDGVLIRFRRLANADVVLTVEETHVFARELIKYAFMSSGLARAMEKPAAAESGAS